jgi:hypothetical protein
MRLKLLAFALAFAAATAAAQEAETPPPAPDYANDAHWLCRPGRQDPCSTPLPTTALNPNGYGSTGVVRPAADPGIDCFYVYPTVSRDRTMNSDLETGPEERATAMAQAARFGTVCRTFAPMYRQLTTTALGRYVGGGGDPRPLFALAYEDVRAAWRNYLERDNHGRPFVLIGHSQGSIHLIRLIAEEIEGRPEARRMLSAILLGYTVEVPEGRTVGGTFRETPLCTARGQTGCIVTYMSFRATSPPPAGSLFGRAARPGMTAACTNPAALGGSSGRLDSYWFAGGATPQGAEPIVWSSEGSPPTPFLRTEGLVSAACVHRGQVGYLSVAVNADPSDARTDRIPGDVYLFGRPAPGWGMHLADMPLAQGDLIRIVAEQGAAFRRRRR